MPTPSVAEVRASLVDVAYMIDNARLYAAFTSTTNFLQTLDDYTQAAEGEFVPAVLEKLQSARSNLSTFYESLWEALDGVVLEYARVLGYNSASAEEAFAAVKQSFRDNSVTIQERNLVFGTPSAGGGNVGNGVINRLTVDGWAYELEAEIASSKAIVCVADRFSGASQHSEVLRFRTATGRDVDNLRIFDGFEDTDVTCLSGKDSEAFLTNPSFSEYTGTVTVPTAITGWTVTTDIANLEIDTTNYYRGYDGDTTPAALKVKANETVTQAFSVKPAQYDPETPYYVQIAWNGTTYSAVGGTITLTFGDQTASVAVAQSGWQILRIAIGTKNWYRVFNAASPVVSIAWASRTSGSLLWDDVIIGAYTQVGGTYYAPVGGSTAFLLEDSFTWADTIATEGKVQRALVHRYGDFWPAASSPTIADP